jgi:hypothetical protein
LFLQLQIHDCSPCVLAFALRLKRRRDGPTPFPDGLTPFPDGLTPFPDGLTSFPDGLTPFPDGHSGRREALIGFPDACFPDQRRFNRSEHP